MIQKHKKKRFKCLRCGRCCLRVSLAARVPPCDVEKWKRAGRFDILKWASVEPDGCADIWVNRYSGDDDLPVTCPWLRKDEDKKLLCEIYELRPTVCSTYGHDENHARQTKCPFYSGEPFKPKKYELKRIPTINTWKDYHVSLDLRVPDTESLDALDVLTFVRYKITGDKRFYKHLGAESGLRPEDVLSKLEEAITILHGEIEEE